MDKPASAGDGQKKIELFERRPIPQAVMVMSVPTVLSSLVMVLYSLVDTYFVGLLNDPVQTAAVTLASPVILAFNAVNNLFGVGSSTMMSRAMGRHDYDTVKKASSFGFYCALASGVIFSLSLTILRQPLLVLLGTDADTVTATGEYLRWTVSCGAVPAILNVVMAYLVRAEGSSLHASIGTMSGCLLNIILDPVFILPWGLGLGAAGAGLATFISNCAACLYFLILLYIRRKKTFVSISFSMFHPTKAIVREVFSVGIPAAIQNLLNVTSMTVMNNFMSAYGSDAVAAMGIAQKLNMIPMQISMGLSQGIMPIVSYNYASRNVSRMKDTVLFAWRIVLAFLCLTTVVYYINAGWLISLFMENETIISYGSRFLRGLCLAEPFLCTDFLGVGVYQACGMGSRAFVFAIMRKVVLEIPALIILNRVWPMYGLAYAQPAAEAVLAVAAVIVVAGIFRDLEKEAQGQEVPSLASEDSDN